MKAIDWDKVFKAIGIIAIIVLVFMYFDARSSKAYKRQEDTYNSLSFLAEELTSMGNDAYDAYKSDDFYAMSETLYDIYTKCEKYSNEADRISSYYEMKDSE